jgi:hypothetical protein
MVDTPSVSLAVSVTRDRPPEIGPHTCRRSDLSVVFTETDLAYRVGSIEACPRVRDPSQICHSSRPVLTYDRDRARTTVSAGAVRVTRCRAATSTAAPITLRPPIPAAHRLRSARLPTGNTGHATVLAWAFEHAPGPRLGMPLEGTYSYRVGSARARPAFRSSRPNNPWPGPPRAR